MIIQCFTDYVEERDMLIGWCIGHGTPVYQVFPRAFCCGRMRDSSVSRMRKEVGHVLGCAGSVPGQQLPYVVKVR